jgi:hypothetical protein
LKRPASSKLTAIPKGFLPCPLVIHPVIRLRDIRKVDVAAHSVLIPPKYGIDRYAKFDRIILIDTVGIDLEVFQSVYYGLLHIELYLPPPSLVYSVIYIYTNLDILKNDLLFSPGMREYCVGRDIADSRFAKDDLAVVCTLQEAYKRYSDAAYVLGKGLFYPAPYILPLSLLLYIFINCGSIHVHISSF